MTLEDRCGTDHIIEVGIYHEEMLMVHSVKRDTVEARIYVVIQAPDGSIWKSGDRVVKIKLRKVTKKAK